MRIKLGHLRQIIREVAGQKDIDIYYRRAYDEALEAWNRGTSGVDPGRVPWEIIQRHLADRPADQDSVIKDIRKVSKEAADNIEAYRVQNPGPPRAVVDPRTITPGGPPVYHNE